MDKTYSIFDHAQLGRAPTVNAKTANNEALRGAWQREKDTHPHWPGTFEACMLNPLVRAVLLAKSRAVPAVTRKTLAVRRGGSFVDWKMAQANDRE